MFYETKTIKINNFLNFKVLYIAQQLTKSNEILMMHENCKLFKHFKNIRLFQFWIVTKI